MEEKKKLIKQSKIMIAMALVIVFVLAGTYAWMMLSKTSTVVNKITAGNLDLELVCSADGTCDGIYLEKQVPMSYQQGLTTKAYKFKLRNNGGIAADYTINLEDFYENITIPTEGKFEDSKIRYIILKDDETPVASNSKLLSEGRNLTTGTIEGNSEVEYTLYMWIDSRAGIEVNGQVFGGKIRVDAIPSSGSDADLTGDWNIPYKLGEYVTMVPSKTSFTTDHTITGAESDETIYPQELTSWIIYDIAEDGTMELLSEYASDSKVTFSGQAGYKNYVGYLNKLASQYENKKFTIGSRSIGYNGQTEYLTGDITKELGDTVSASYSSTPSYESSGYGEYNDGFGGDNLHEKDFIKLQQNIGKNYSTTTASDYSTTAVYWIAGRDFNSDLLGTPNVGYYWRLMTSSRTNGFASTAAPIYYRYRAFTVNKPSLSLRPIVKVKAGLPATGSGTKDDPYILGAIPKTYDDSETVSIDKSLVAAYNYNSTSCITGEEETCEATTCYKDKTAGACPAGTIIKYKVNDTTEKYFHVLHDDGEKITMQQRENTTDDVVWYSSNTKAEGPLVALSALENATKDWTNLNTIEYTAGVTPIFGDSSTECDYDDITFTCGQNSYTLGERKVKARMITVPEALSVGCDGTDQSCPIWMYNYLTDVISYGGTVNVETDSNGNSILGYWTMTSKYGSATNKNAYVINFFGRVGYRRVNQTPLKMGTRAVVEINKYGFLIRQKQPWAQGF